MVGRSHGGPDAQRRSAIVLATHLIRGGALEVRDEDALLGWAVRETPGKMRESLCGAGVRDLFGPIGLLRVRPIRLRTDDTTRHDMDMT